MHLSFKTRLSLVEPPSVFVDVSLMLLYISVLALLYIFRAVDLTVLIVCFDLMTVFLLIRSWKRFHGGMHPCWLFLLAVGFFQCGALLGYLFGDTSDPFVVTMMFISPFSVAEPYKAETLLCIALSMVFVYLPCAYQVSPKVYSAAFSLRFRQVIRWIFYVFLPFEFYKVWAYVRFTQSHGGYAANLLMNTELRDAAGMPVRLASFVCASAFYLLLLTENRMPVLKYVYVFYISALLLSLGIGDRGGVLTQFIMIWFVHKFKTGKSFKLVPMLIIGCLGAILSAFIGHVRSNEAIEGSMNIVHFITGQGISLQVTELAVAEHDTFAPHAISYLLCGSGLCPGEIQSGQMLNRDVSEHLSSVRVEQGLGTGSSFVAEAFLLGGIAGVIIVSLCIGLALRLLHSVSDKKYGLAPTIMFLAAIVFMPRAEILSPVHSGLQIGVGMALVGAFAHFAARFFGFVAQPISRLPQQLRSSAQL